MKRLIAIGVVFLLVGSWLLSRYLTINKQKKVEQEVNEHRKLLVLLAQKEKKEHEIIPASFSIGPVNNPGQSLSNNCSDMLSSASMYPVQPVYVDYGDNYVCGGNSDVVTFNSPP